MEAGLNFVHGTSARKLEYPLHIEKNIKKMVVPKVSYAKLKVVGVVLVLTVFAFLFTLIYRYSMITEMEYKCTTLNKEYIKIKNENSRLKIEIESSSDPYKIKEMAERLGLQHPDKNQKVYIMVPKSDFTKVSDKFKQESLKQNTIIASMMNFLHLN